jgi:hypothetical protein
MPVLNRPKLNKIAARIRGLNEIDRLPLTKEQKSYVHSQYKHLLRVEGEKRNKAKLKKLNK